MYVHVMVSHPLGAIGGVQKASSTTWYTPLPPAVASDGQPTCISDLQPRVVCEPQHTVVSDLQKTDIKRPTG